jgi:hypothetical protein
MHMQVYKQLSQMNDKSIQKTVAEFNKFITVQSHTIQSMKFVVCVATNTSPN